MCVHRQECKKLREELREDHEDDKRAALTQLAQNKEQELGSARESWQRKVEDLLEQVRDSPPSPCCTTLQLVPVISRCSRVQKVEPIPKWTRGFPPQILPVRTISPIVLIWRPGPNGPKYKETISHIDPFGSRPGLI